MFRTILATAGLLYVQATYSSSDVDEYLQSMNKDHGDSDSQSQPSGNYQQYMDKYAGGSHGGDYQQYMKKYAGSHANYEQYMNKYAQGSQGGSQAGDYQQYMKKYAGGQGGDYQQYMKKYAGGQGGDYQQYMNKYTKGSQDSSTDSAAPLNLLGDPSKTGDSKSGGDYQQYMNQYAGGQGGSSGNYQKYMKQYAGQYAGKYSDEYQKYADYQKYIKRYQNEHGQEIGSAHDAQNKGQLDKWYAGANQNLQYYVPDAYSKYAHHDIDKQYETRLAELQGVTTTGGPLEVTDLNLAELPKKVQTELPKKIQNQKSAEAFLAKSADTKTQSEKLAQEVDTAKAQVAANLHLLAEQVKADPGTYAGMALLGVVFAFVVFFGMRHRRTVQTPTIMLG